MTYDPDETETDHVHQDGPDASPSSSGGCARGRVPPLLIDVSEAARLTGLSVRTVWRFASSGRFPLPVKIGGRRLWSRSQLIQWVESGCLAVDRIGREGGATR